MLHACAVRFDVIENFENFLAQENSYTCYCWHCFPNSVTSVWSLCLLDSDDCYYFYYCPGTVHNQFENCTNGKRYHLTTNVVSAGYRTIVNRFVYLPLTLNPANIIIEG